MYKLSEAKVLREFIHGCELLKIFFLCFAIILSVMYVCATRLSRAWDRLSLTGYYTSRVDMGTYRAELSWVHNRGRSHKKVLSES